VIYDSKGLLIKREDTEGPGEKESLQSSGACLEKSKGNYSRPFGEERKHEKENAGDDGREKKGGRPEKRGDNQRTFGKVSWLERKGKWGGCENPKQGVEKKLEKLIAGKFEKKEKKRGPERQVPPAKLPFIQQEKKTAITDKQAEGKCFRE